MLLDFLFPPLCICCKGRILHPFFCAACWELCTPLDPVGRCRHCFTEWTNGEFCGKCQLPFRRAVVFESSASARMLCRKKEGAIGGFVLYQWIQMQWPIPEVVIPMPGMDLIAKTFAFFLYKAGTCSANILSRKGRHWSCNEEVLEEGQTILLLDAQSSLFTLKKAAQSLLETSPKKIFQLSLFHDPSFVSCPSSVRNFSLPRDSDHSTAAGLGRREIGKVFAHS